MISKIQNKELKSKKDKEEFNMSILLPGGAGYIGSHTAVELLKA